MLQLNNWFTLKAVAGKASENAAENYAFRLFLLVSFSLNQTSEDFYIQFFSGK